MSGKSGQITANTNAIIDLQHGASLQTSLSTRVTRLEAMQQAELTTMQDIQKDVRDLRDFLMNNGPAKERGH